MSQDWFPWYPVLFKADTLHLTAAQDGIYRRLIDWYMETRRPLPDVDRALAAIARVGLDEWLPHATVIRAYFSSKNGLLRHKRCDRELDTQDKFSKIRSEVAEKGAAARWGKINGIDASGILEASGEHASSKASASFQHATGQDKTRQKKKDSLGASAPMFDEFWKAYPSRAAHPNPRKPAAAKFAIAVKAGVDPAAIIAGAKRYADDVRRTATDPQFVCQATTWLNQERWKDQPKGDLLGTGYRPAVFEG